MVGDPTVDDAAAPTVVVAAPPPTGVKLNPSDVAAENALAGKPPVAGW